MPLQIIDQSRLMENDPSVVYALDQSLSLVYCNAAWDRFARDNGAPPSVFRQFQAGLPLMAAIPEVLRSFYREALDGVLTTGVEWQHTYECSSARQFRLYRMRVVRSSDSSGLLVVNSLAIERPHEEGGSPADLRPYTDRQGFLWMCANCRRFKHCDSGRWDWFPDLVRTIPGKVSHALCAACWALHYPGYLPKA